VSGIKKIKKEISEITRDAGDLRNKKKSTAGAKSELMNRLTKDAEVVLQKLKIKNAVVEITMLPDAQMRFLEKKYMKKEKKIVDVLNYGVLDPEDVRTRTIEHYKFLLKVEDTMAELANRLFKKSTQSSAKFPIAPEALKNHSPTQERA
jgi:ssRNA-specific RNase YbeY (16S rRNA maturation enzyme)